MLALTFDDGPDPRGTPAVLEALAEAGVRATFFVLGAQIERYPALLERVIAAGHEVEVHGFEHVRHPFTARAEVERDIDRALQVLATAGVTPRHWRIPWGHLASFTPQIAEARQLAIVGWTSDTHDWRGDGAAEMLAELELAHGGIVLAHDGIGNGAQRSTAQATAELIGPLVARARTQGLQPGPLRPGWPIAIPVGNPEFHPGVVQAA